MSALDNLRAGYRTFLENRYGDEAALYKHLADEGQSPQTAIIACCDSRVDPATIFHAGPGQIYVIRNVANLVPPFEPEGDYHGTSAALEYAVSTLKVEQILVLGHGDCGGVKSFLNRGAEKTGTDVFVRKWLALLEPAEQGLQQERPEITKLEQQIELEHASVRLSLANLVSFPFVRNRMAAGTLRLRGAFFDIRDGILFFLDDETGKFIPVPAKAPASD